jgi:toxin-antitoxin system PIN domain toxin
VILPDVNVLVHAYDPEFRHHWAARQWWEDTLNLDRPVGLAWAVVLGFLRLTTNRAVLRRPLAASEAVQILRTWVRQPSVRLLVPGEGHAELLFHLLEEVGVAGNLTTDAHLAALAIEYRAEIATTDADFARFPGLKWFNPLEGRPRGPRDPRT